jgi:hypothetical protein
VYQVDQPLNCFSIFDLLRGTNRTIPNYVHKFHLGKVNMELKLDATITVLLISKISSTCFGQTFAHLQERKNETFKHMLQCPVKMENTIFM